MTLPTLYAILDRETLDRRGVALRDFCDSLRAGGVTLLQYRDKLGSPREILTAAATVRAIFPAGRARLILNDRADLAVLAGFDGVHVGQGDLSPEDARHVVGHNRIVGISTHTEPEMHAAAASAADYIAVGPVFTSPSKADAAPVVGLEGVRLARSLTRQPLVAIGGITPTNAASVFHAGADTIAVISAFFDENKSVEQLSRTMAAASRAFSPGQD